MSCGLVSAATDARAKCALEDIVDFGTIKIVGVFVFLITCFLFLWLMFSSLIYFFFFENSPAPFPGRMSYKVTKPGL